MGKGKEGCEFGRKLEQRVDSMERQHNQAVDRIEESVSDLTKEMRGRPTWAVSITITVLVSALSIMVVLLAAGA